MRQISELTATIANGASVSGIVYPEAGWNNQPYSTRKLVGIVMPATWTTANLTLQASADGTNFYDVYDANGIEYVITAAASRYIALDVSAFLGFRTFKVRSGTSGTAVNQGGDRVIKLLFVDQA